MKHISGRLFIVGGNLLGAFIILLLLEGLRITGRLTLPRSSLFGIAGLCILILGGMNIFFISHWFVAPLSRLLRTIQSFHAQTGAPENTPARITELRVLEQTLHRQQQEMHNLIRAGEDFLESGKFPEDTTNFPHNELGNIGLHFMHTLTGMKDYITLLIDGQWYRDIPENIAHTTFGQALRIMTSELRTIISDLRKETSRLSASSAKVAAMSQQGSRNATTTTQEIETISSSIHEVAGNLREVLQNIRRQADSLEHTFADIQDLLTSTEHINSSALID